MSDEKAGGAFDEIIESAEKALKGMEEHPTRHVGPSGMATDEGIKTALRNQIKLAKALKKGIDGGTF